MSQNHSFNQQQPSPQRSIQLGEQSFSNKAHQDFLQMGNSSLAPLPSQKIMITIIIPLLV
jgi:hypothetical protein